MSIEKFTKGDWEVDKSYHTMLMVSGGDVPVCEIQCRTENDTCTTMPTEEEKANANLIAAAPEMYRLLEKFIPCDEDGNGEFIYNDGSEYLGEAVNKLLEKALGQ